jgi:hypothetical protein
LGERAPTKNKEKRKDGKMRKYVRKMEDAQVLQNQVAGKQ